MIRTTNTYNAPSMNGVEVAEKSTDRRQRPMNDRYDRFTLWEQMQGMMQHQVVH